MEVEQRQKATGCFDDVIAQPAGTLLLDLMYTGTLSVEVKR